MAKSSLLKLNNWFKGIIRLVITLVIILWGADKAFPLNLIRYQDTSVTVFGSNKDLLHVFLSKDEKFRLQTRQEDVTPLYIKTLLAREDRFYHSHFGVNPFSILRATYQRIKAGRVLSGGSTLTMQTARLLEPRKRSIKAKIIESLRAIQLEWHFSKAQILEIYLTLAPFGSNIEGVRAAAFTYFNKTPNNLNPAEVALLVAMVQSPNTLRADLNSKKTYTARRQVLQLMQNKGFITSHEQFIHQEAPFPKMLTKFPRQIPHLAWRLQQENPNSKEIITTIDIGLQKQVEHLLTRYRSFLPSKANAAIFILDHAQNKPLAYVASCDYFDKTHQGFVDYIRSYRSPGSTLKPFIFAMAFDSGRLQPESLILDTRQRFGSYSPRNFDKNVHGMVQAKEALASSLNIPAVAVLNDVGVIRFISLLEEMGVSLKFPNHERPGLSSALGGLGITLEQLVLLYSGLANQGKVKSFSYLADSKLQKETYLVSERVAEQIKSILADESNGDNSFSVKTGTSYGHRDVLAIGYNNQYVIGIWIGTPKGTPMREATGTNMAVPLLKKITPLLPRIRNVTVKNLEMKNNVVFKKFNLVSAGEVESEPLQLLFPVDNTVISHDQAEIPCRVRGGSKPYTWLVDGNPQFTQSWQQKFTWCPHQPGYYKITVVDANGKSVNANIQIN